ncbi:hypothetical protein [Pseudacidovorax sp. RU35E]|jgi:hypothetical protein|nr:hypothetical protein [Pseudacidovorax sp. RU35E]SIQ01664.1 hypothetical protein SAMN05880557_101529 [Pseudacidovorax sp. RU35E]
MLKAKWAAMNIVILDDCSLKGKVRILGVTYTRTYTDFDDLGLL